MCTLPLSFFFYQKNPFVLENKALLLPEATFTIVLLRRRVLHKMLQKKSARPFCVLPEP